MNQTRRPKYFQITVLFLLYSLIQVVSADKEVPQDELKHKNESTPTTESTVSDVTPSRLPPSTKHTTTTRTSHLSTAHSSSTTSAGYPPSKSSSTAGTRRVHQKNLKEVVGAGVAGGVGVHHALTKNTTVAPIGESGNPSVSNPTVRSSPEVKNTTTSEDQTGCTPPAIKQVRP